MYENMYNEIKSGSACNTLMEAFISRSNSKKKPDGDAEIDTELPPFLREKLLPSLAQRRRRGLKAAAATATTVTPNDEITVTTNADNAAATTEVSMSEHGPISVAAGVATADVNTVVTTTVDPNSEIGSPFSPPTTPLDSPATDTNTIDGDPSAHFEGPLELSPAGIAQLRSAGYVFPINSIRTNGKRGIPGRRRYNTTSNSKPKHVHPRKQLLDASSPSTGAESLNVARDALDSCVEGSPHIQRTHRPRDQPFDGSRLKGTGDGPRNHHRERETSAFIVGGNTPAVGDSALAAGGDVFSRAMAGGVAGRRRRDNSSASHGVSSQAVEVAGRRRRRRDNSSTGGDAFPRAAMEGGGRRQRSVTTSASLATLSLGSTDEDTILGGRGKEKTADT